MLQPRSLGFTVLLGALAALPPLSIDLGLPALPAAGAAFGVSPGVTGLTLSLFMTGFALAQLIFGPLSDQVGRRPVLLAGCSLFTLAGLGCTLANSIPMLLAARFVQGSGAGAGTVMAFAIIRDLFQGQEARAKLSYVSAILGIAPVVAPSAGALLVDHGGWRAIYAVLAIAGMALFAAVAAGLAESRVAGATGPAPGYRKLLADRQIATAITVNGLSFGCMFSYVAGSPLLLIEGYRLTPFVYGLIFACTAGGIMAGAAANGWLAHRQVRIERPVGTGVAVAAATAVLLALLFLTQARPPLAAVLPLLVLNTFCLGLISPNAVHLALAARPGQAGAVSALVGFAQMSGGAIASAVTGTLQSHIGMPATAVTMTGFAACSLAVWHLSRLGSGESRTRADTASSAAGSGIDPGE